MLKINYVFDRTVQGNFLRGLMTDYMVCEMGPESIQNCGVYDYDVLKEYM